MKTIQAARRAVRPRTPAQQRLAARTAALMETTIRYFKSRDFRSLSPQDLLAEPDLTASGGKAPEGTPPYLAALYEYPLLTPAQEQQLFRKLNFLKHQAVQIQKSLTLSKPDARKIQQIDKLLAQAEAVRNRIVQCNLRLVVGIAKTLVTPTTSLDELISEGNLPLIRAVELFDFTRGLRFSTYATWAVRNGLYRVSSRNHSHGKRYFASPLETVPDPKSDQPADQLSTAQRERLLQLVRRLDERSQTIVCDRFGLSETLTRPAKFRELAAKLKLSTERVRQLFSRALENLRGMAKEGEIVEGQAA